MHTYRWLALSAALVALTGCGKGISGYSCSRYPMTTLPMSSLDYRGIVPLGGVAPLNEDVFPATHVSFYVKVDTLGKPIKSAVYSPGPMKFTKIWKTDHYTSSTDKTVAYTDYRLDFKACGELTGYLTSVYELSSVALTPIGSVTDGFTENCTEDLTSGDPGMTCARNISADYIAGGQVIGYTGRSTPTNVYRMDFGTLDSRVTSSSWNTTKLTELKARQNVVCPFDYYDPSGAPFAETRQYLGAADRSFVRTDATPCGKADWEQSGTASGIWIAPGRTVLPENYHLVFMNYNVNPAYGLMSIGDTAATTFSVTHGGYIFARNSDATGGTDYVNPDFDRVAIDGRIACWQTLSDQNSTTFTALNFYVLAQLTDATHMKFEMVYGTSCPAVASRAFSANVVTYEK